MRNNILWFFTALSLVSGIALAEPYRHRAQPERARAWVLDAGGLFLEQAGKPRRPFRLADWTWAGQPYACAPDIAIGPRGEVIVTSNVVPVLWKIDPDTLAVSVHRLQLDADADKDVGFSGLAYSERDGAYFAVSELHGSLWRIDPTLSRAQKIALSEPARGACALSMQGEERLSRFTRLCLQGKSVSLSPDQRSAYVQSTGCPSNPFALTGGSR